MAFFADNLFSLRGRVMANRPGVTPDMVVQWLNDRLRQVLDNSLIWADLLQPGMLSFPNATSAGAINLTTGSPIVQGNATFWPVADVVNTIIPAGVPEFGYVEVTPTSMAGITANSYLYVDAAGTPEIVPVVLVTRTSFTAIFQQLHNPDCTVTQSSLANQQFRLGESYPIFTIGAVTYLDPSGSGNGTLQLTLPWGAASVTAQPYTILLMYVTLGSDFKDVIVMKDEQTGYPIRLHVTVAEVDYRDPQRTLVTGNPWFSLVGRGANAQGNLWFEMWPAPQTQRQFSYLYSKQWPDMVKDSDMPPPFINPSILFHGALADAKRMRMSGKDPYYDMQGADYYEKRFMQGVMDARNANQAKVFTALKEKWMNQVPMNYDMLQLQDGSLPGFWSGAM